MPFVGISSVRNTDFAARRYSITFAGAREDVPMKETLLSLLLLAGGPPEAEAASAPQAFSFTGPRNRIITPNGDGKNDVAVFEFSNPTFAEVTGRVYDTRGNLVASLAPGMLAGETLYWDGKSGGRAVPGGVYIYVIEAQTQVVRGTVLVVR